MQAIFRLSYDNSLSFLINLPNILILSWRFANTPP